MDLDGGAETCSGGGGSKCNRETGHLGVVHGLVSADLAGRDFLWQSRSGAGINKGEVHCVAGGHQGPVLWLLVRDKIHYWARSCWEGRWHDDTFKHCHSASDSIRADLARLLGLFQGSCAALRPGDFPFQFSCASFSDFSDFLPHPWCSHTFSLTGLFFILFARIVVCLCTTLSRKKSLEKSYIQCGLLEGGPRASRCCLLLAQRCWYALASLGHLCCR